MPIIVIAILRMLIVSYLNSPLFIKQFILPKIADEFHLDISAGDISFSIFDGIAIRDLEVQNDQEMLLKAKLIKVNYFWKAALNRKIHINEIFIENGYVHLVKNVDGSLNLPESPRQSTPVSNSSSTPANAPPKLTIDTIDLKNCHLIYDDKTTGSSLSFDNISIAATNLAANALLEANITSTLSFSPPKNRDIISCAVTIILSTELNEAFLPDQIRLKLDANSFIGNYQSISLNGRRLECEFVAHAEGDGYRLDSILLISMNTSIKLKT